MDDTGTTASKPKKPAVTRPLHQHAEQAAQNGKRRPILICEDDDEIRALLIETIQNEGYAIAVACNGQEALTILQQRPGRFLVLMDLLMPRLSGYQLLELMSADDSLLAENVVVILSATGFIRPISPAVRAKQVVKATLPKPFDIDELLDVVRRFS
jgi:CheY-like chemotaxis protein